MSNQTDLPFPAVLASLFGETDVPVYLVYRLSDLSADELALFRREWAQLGDERRIAVARHMADISEENFVVDFVPLFLHFFDDHHAAVREAALDGIWDATEARLVPPVIKLLQTDPVVSVRTAAARALAHYVLMAEWGEVEHAVAAPIVEALLAEYERPAVAPEVKRAALEAVASSDHPRVPDLIRDAYDEGDNDLQLSALFAMGVSADTRWVSTLEDEMGSPSADFRAEAARAAGGVGSSDSLDSLEQLLVDEELEVALAAVYALGQIGGERAAGLLQRAADDPDFEELYDAIDDALEEMDWLGGGFDLLAIDEDDDDDLINLRAN